MFYLKDKNFEDNIRKISFYIMRAKRLGSRGETTRLKIKGETTKGEMTRGGMVWGETSYYLLEYHE